MHQPAWLRTIGCLPLLVFSCGLLLHVPAAFAEVLIQAPGGGGCEQVGEWNETTYTCTVTRDISEPVVISSSPLVTLDGANHTIDVASGDGLMVRESMGVNIRNIRVRGARIGIYVDRSDSLVIAHAAVESSYRGIHVFDTSNVTVRESTVSGSEEYPMYSGISVNVASHVSIHKNHVSAAEIGFAADRVHDSVFTENQVDGAFTGIRIERTKDTLFADNTVTNSGSTGFHLYTVESFRNDITRNTFSGNELALRITGDFDFEGGPQLSRMVPAEPHSSGVLALLDAAWHSVKHGAIAALQQAFFPVAFAESDDDNLFFQNIFLNNAAQVSVEGTVTVRFFQPPPTGGNQWDTHDELSEGCVDANRDSFCDEPFVLDEESGLSDLYARSVDVAVPSCTEECYSNVLFIPGIKASRLYMQRGEGCMLNCEDQLWEPNANGDVEDLFLHPDGTSVRGDVYTRDILDEYFAPGNSDVYKTFSDFMNALAEGGVINEWRAVPYDWRLDLEHTVLSGTSVDGRLSYIGAATSSHAIGQLEALAANSKSGKVTIVAHSNGGLFTKVLMEELERAGKTGLVDTVIFIGVPQTGTPKAIATLLHGYDEALLAGLVTKTSTARQLAENLPGAYNLLPSAKYFEDVATPPVAFSPDAISAGGVRAAYGDGIETYQELHRFLLGLEGRGKPAVDDTDEPNTLNGGLLARADELHARLDSWAPPDGVELIKLAGVGIETPAQFVYMDDCSFWCLFSDPSLGYEPTMVIEGDGTVVDASALAGPGSKYFFNIADHNRTNTDVEHSTIMSALAVNDFIQRTLIGESELPTTITTTKPSFESETQLRYRVHSPVTLDVYDSSGNHTGIATTTLPDGTVVRYAENDVPGTRYDEFGEVKYVYSDGSTPLRIVLDGQSSGYATFDIAETAGNTISASTTYTNIPIEPQTIIIMNVSAGSTLAGASGLHIDTDGDGAIDVELPVGDIVNYGDFVPQSEEETGEPQAEQTPTAPQGGGGGTIVGLIGTMASSSVNSELVTATSSAEVDIATSSAPESLPAARTSATRLESQQKPISVAEASKIVKQAPKNSITKTNNATLVAGVAGSLQWTKIDLRKTKKMWFSRIYRRIKSFTIF